MSYNNVKWYINNTCNLSCPFCFVKGVCNSEKTLDDKFKILDKLYRDGIIYIDFFGKEPLFNDDIFKIMKYGVEQKYNELYYTFITNGVNLKKYTPEIIDSPCRNFTVSFDFHIGERKFKFDLNDLLPLSGHGFLIELAIDLHKSNLEVILEKSFELYNYGVTSLYFNPITSFGNVNVSSISDEEYEDFILRFYDMYSKYFELTFKIPFEMVRLTKKYSGNSLFYTEPYCTGGIDHFCISSDGIAFGCVSQCAAGNMSNTCDYLTTDIHEIYRKLSHSPCIRLCKGGI